MPVGQRQLGAARGCSVQRRQPAGAADSRTRVEKNHRGRPDVHARPRGSCGFEGIDRGAAQANHAVFGGGIGELGFGTEHEHRQALDHGRHAVARTQQQHLFSAALDDDEADLHPPLGIAVSSQSGTVVAEQDDVLGQLTLQEGGGVGTGYADHAHVGQIHLARLRRKRGLTGRGCRHG